MCAAWISRASTRGFAFLLLVLGGAPLCRAASITYNVNLTIGTASATGTITTDGTIGPLAQSDLLTWNLSLASGGASFDLLGPLSGANSKVAIVDLFSHGNFSATATQLLYNFSLGGTSLLNFYTTAGTNLCFSTEGCLNVNETNGEGIIINNDVGTFQFVSLSGTIAIATALGEPQTITFDSIPNQIFGISPFVIAAQASSLLPVSFAATTPLVCKNSDDLVMLLGAGTCSITASQNGNATYAAANPVTHSFTVSLTKPSGSLTAAAGSPVAVGTNPGAAVVGDFNGDGIPDLAVVNLNGGTLTVLLGNGSGGFVSGPGSPFAVGTVGAEEIYSVVAGDFNGDGIQDLAISNSDLNNVTVLLGNGTGGFTPAPGSPVAVGHVPISVGVGDFNGDGIQDLAVANAGSSNITVLLGNGSGGFAAASGSPVAIGANIANLAVGDFNGDGIQDLAVSGFVNSSQITVLLGKGSGGFTAAPNSPFPAGTIPGPLTVGDFNGDGIQDLATVDPVGNDVTVLLGNGSGGFTPAPGSPFAVGSDPDSIAVGDFNGDGIQDLVTANQHSNNVTLLLGNGSGGFTAATYGPFAVGLQPLALAVGDFNGDGILDFATANSGSNSVTVWLGLVVGNTSQTITFAPLSAVTYGASPFQISASSSSGLTVSFASTTSAVCTTAGSTITIVAPGLCSIVASQEGNATFAAAATVTQILTVRQSQTITFGALSNVAYGASPFTISATVNSQLAVSFASTTPPVCTVSGSTVTILAVGTCSITASQAGNANYAAATPVTRSFTVSAAGAGEPAILYDNLGSGNSLYATNSFYLVNSATGGWPGAGLLEHAFAFTPAVNADFTELDIAIGLVTGNGSMTVDLMSDANGLPGNVLESWNDTGLPGSNSCCTMQVLLGNGTIPLVVGTTYWVAVLPDANTWGWWDPTTTGVNGLHTFNSGSGWSTAATATAGAFEVQGTTLAVASQTIAFDAIPNQILGISPFPIAAQASSLLPVSFGSSTPTVCKNSDDLVMLLSAGTCSITASQGGNASYDAAPTVAHNFTVSLAKPSGSFTAAPGSPFAVGSVPYSAAVGDFNGDGIPDLAIANESSSSVTVLLGNGSGGFTAAPGSPFAVGSGPVSVVVGDFNGDGIQDLAVANLGSANVTVLLGNGSGGFIAANASPFAAGTGPVAMAVGDFNADGIQDLAVANGNGGNGIGNNVTVLLGNGSGGFTPSLGSPFAVGSEPLSIAVGDFNGDGIQDLATANQNDGTVTVLLANGSGGFTPAPGSPFAAGADSVSVVVGDFNGDGIQDLAVADYGSYVTVLLGNGLGGFTPAAGSPFVLGYGPDSLVVGDFNGDGIQDLAAANFGYVNQRGSNVTVLLGNGSGGFTAATGSPYAVGSAPIAVVAGDFNGDGIEDLATANYGSNNVTVLLGLAVGNTSQTITFAAPGAITYGASPFAIIATASSGLTVSFASTTSGVCTVAGSTVTIAAAGTCSIIASQAGNATYAAAATVARSFTVNKASQTIAFAPLNNQTLGSPPPALSAMASSGLTVGFASTTPGACTVSGTTVTLVSVGTCTIQATQAGNANYAAAAPVNQSFQVTQSGQNFITDLGTLGGTYGYANAINNAGQVVGASYTTGNAAQHAFLYSGGVMTDLGTLGGTTSQAFGINAGGQIVGNANVPGGLSHAFLYSGGVMTDLSTPAGLTTSDSLASGINDAGEIVGNGFSAETGAAVGFLYSGGTTPTYLPTFGGISSNPSAINNAGQVVGDSELTGNSEQDPFLYSGGAITDLGTLGGSGGSALAINASGQVVGFVYVGPAMNSNAFLYSGGVMTNLGTLGGLNSQALGINGAGQIVGYSSTASSNGASDAFFYSGGIMKDLNSLLPANSGWQLTSAKAINDSGQIVGYGSFNGQTHAFLINLGLAAPTVSFTGAPASAAYQSTFAVSATTNASTVAVITAAGACTIAGNTVTMTASTGTCNLTANWAADSNYLAASATQSTAAVMASQTINFSALSNQTLGTAPFAVSAKTTSGLPVSFASTTTPICTVSGSTVTLVSVGTCSITASQAGNSDFAAATPVTETFTVSAIIYNNFGSGYAITWDDGWTISGTLVPLMASEFTSPGNYAVTQIDLAVSNISGDNGAVVSIWTVSAGVPGAKLGSWTLTNLPAYGPSESISTINGINGVTLSAGATYFLAVAPLDSTTADFLSDSNPGAGGLFYHPPTYTTATYGELPAFDVIGVPAGSTSQTIAFDAIPNQVLGVSPFPIAAQASSLLPVSFVSTTPAVCKNSDDLVMLLSAGTCSITASQGGNASYGAATPVSRSFTVSLAKPSGTLTAAAGSFIAVGSVFVSAAVGDFNGDGIPDLAMANYGGNNVTVLLGNGSGGFTAAPGNPFAVGTWPWSVAVGDFNGDGVLDLATANSNGDNVTVLLGNGSGGFTPAPGSPFSAGTNPRSVAVGDFNGDGILDLATANSGDNNVTVLLGNGSGGFTPAPGSPFSVGTGPNSVAVGDFNGDGNQDLAVANFDDGNVTVLLGNGLGSFTPASGSPFSVGSGPNSVAVGDFNGDGSQDLAIGNNEDENVTVLLGNGLGSFTPASGSPFSVGSGPNSVAVGDFNGDGIPDLVTVSEPAYVTVLLGNGSGGFAPTRGGPFFVGAGPLSVVVADFNADGLLDLATAFPSGEMVLLGGKASTSSTLSTTSPLTITQGQSVSVTLTVSDAVTAFSTPTGTATFLDGTTVLGTASQDGSPYTFSTSSLGVGSRSLTATYGGDTRTLGSTSNSIVIQVGALPSQTITFAPLSNQTIGSSPPALSATASSGLTVSFTSTTSGVCMVSGTTLTLVSVGTCSITASQAGNATYAAATPVTQAFSVFSKSDTILTLGFAGTVTCYAPTCSSFASGPLTGTYSLDVTAQAIVGAWSFTTPFGVISSSDTGSYAKIVTSAGYIGADFGEQTSTPPFSESVLLYYPGTDTQETGPVGPSYACSPIAGMESCYPDNIVTGTATALSATITNFPGGPNSTPTFLLAVAPIAEVTGTIGGGTQDYYIFQWAGGAFNASASITGANVGASYMFSEGTVPGCGMGNGTTLNSSDNFTGTIAISNLAPGQYCIGLIANNSNDPAFTLTFNTPVLGVCDLNNAPSGTVSIADVQLAINEALGASPAVNHLNGNGVINVVDVQIELNAALGVGCAAK